MLFLFPFRLGRRGAAGFGVRMRRFQFRHVAAGARRNLSGNFAAITRTGEKDNENAAAGRFGGTGRQMRP